LFLVLNFTFLTLRKDRVIVDLKNFDLDLQVTLYNDSATLASGFIVGPGGLPQNTNGAGAWTSEFVVVVVVVVEHFLYVLSKNLTN
jgi:hypothetical protein